ncbi:RHO1 GDP-GTP exchange protein 2 [Haplosporangium sp. Z 27]|nr:RHO1 GDP-GTP exchange protein 2 [Haplosporangium sp. Z 27]
MYPSHSSTNSGGPQQSYNNNHNSHHINRTSNGYDPESNGSNQYTSSQQQQHGSQISRIKASRDSTAQKKLAMQLEYQRNLAQLSLAEEEETEYDRTSSEIDRQSYHVDSTLSSIPGSAIASPLALPAYGYAPLAPSLSIPSSFSQNHTQQPQNLNRPGTVLNYPYVQQQFPQYPTQQQQRVLNGSQDQQLYPRNNYGSPSISSPSYSAGYPYSPAGSTVMSSNWSQPPSPGYTPSIPRSQNSLHGSFSSHSSFNPTPYLPPEVELLIDFNPGILSTIAVAFRQKMLDNEAKRTESANYALEFPVTFTGKEAVDVVVELTQLDDRRHALSIARSLESQFLFFGGEQKLFDSNNDQYFFTEPTLAYLPGKSEFPTVPRGVFPYSTKCYSYGCVPGDATCYSYICPNRKRSVNSLGRHKSDASSLGSQEKVWANSVPPSVVAAASKKERSRQEAIFEVVNTERNYVRDLELIEEIFINPLRSGDIIESERLEEFIEDVFLNYKDILEKNKRLLEQLRIRQEEQPMVETIGDVLLAHVVEFEDAYLKYIPRISISEFISKKEEARNPKYAQFLSECSRHPESRRLGLRHFVVQPYQRLPRYPLLLNEVVKNTSEDVGDRQTVQEVIKVCSELGKKIEEAMLEGAQQVRLLSIQDKIIWKSKETQQDLKLGERSRRLLFECVARRKATFDMQSTEFRLFVFDHMLLITKEKRDKQGDKEGYVYSVYKNPIPLELANVYPDDGKSASLSARDYLGGRPRSKSSAPSVSESINFDSTGSSSSREFTATVTIYHRGRRGGEFMFNMTLNDRDALIHQIDIAKTARQEAVSSNLFQFTTIAEMGPQQPSPSAVNSLDGKNVSCSALYINVLDGKKRIVLGTDSGVFVGVEDDPSSFRLAIKDLNATDMSILEDYHLLLILSGKVLKAYNMNCLEPDSDKSFQTGQQVAKNVQYFTAGVCAGKTLVITMKKKGTGAGESLFSAFEPLDTASLGTHHHKGFGGLSLGRSKSDWFKLYREFYVASESSQLQMLSRMVCVVCPRGFEVLMLDNLDETRVYPSKQEAEYAFLLKRPDSVPVSMFKINSDQFLMCYNDFAFTMTKNGGLAKPDLIEFEGRAESFALVHPYIIAFESQLIEIRHIETGALEQIVLGDNIRVLYTHVDLMGNTLIHVLMSHPSHGDVREVVKLAKTQPKTLLEPVKYQPKSTYTPQSTAGSASAVSSQPPTVPTIQPYSVYHPTQTQQLHVKIPTPSIPQQPSPRMTQQQPNYTVSQNTTVYPTTTIVSPRMVQEQPNYTVSPNTAVYPTTTITSPRMAQQQPNYTVSTNTTVYPTTTIVYPHISAAYPVTSSPYMENTKAFPIPAPTSIYQAYPSISAHGNGHDARYQPAVFDSEPMPMPMSMPMPMPKQDITPLQASVAPPILTNNTFNPYTPMASSTASSNPYAAGNSIPYPHYPQAYPSQTNEYPRSSSPSQQAWSPTGFL